MTRASDEFLKALAGLRKAADSDFEGEAHLAAARAIDELSQLAGWEETAISARARKGPSFGAALAEVRRLAERELSGNAFYLASVQLGCAWPSSLDASRPSRPRLLAEALPDPAST